MAGQQIKLFLVDGTPDGLTTAEIANWTGHVLHARRSDLGTLLNRAEAQRTGVYLLLADDPTAIGETRCYMVRPMWWRTGSAIITETRSFGTGPWWSPPRTPT